MPWAAIATAIPPTPRPAMAVETSRPRFERRKMTPTVQRMNLIKDNRGLRFLSWLWFAQSWSKYRENASSRDLLSERTMMKVMMIEKIILMVFWICSLKEIIWVTRASRPRNAKGRAIRWKNLRKLKWGTFSPSGFSSSS